MYDNKHENMTEAMYEFIEKELSISKDKVITNDTYEFYDTLFEALFDIECVEICDSIISPRGKMAADITTVIGDKPEYTIEEIKEEWNLTRRESCIRGLASKEGFSKYTDEELEAYLDNEEE